MITYRNPAQEMYVMDIPGRSFVVTGAAGGLGRELAIRLARDGRIVAAVDRDRDGLEETDRLVRQGGGRAELLELDVCDASALKRAVAAFTEQHGVDLLINCAGIAVFGPAERQPFEDWELALRVNLLGCVATCQAVIPVMKRQRGGHIVNIASAAAYTALPGMGAYNISKAGVLALSETLAAELAPWDIAVTVVCPTFFHSRLQDRMRVADAASAQEADRFFARAEWSAAQVAEAVLQELSARPPYCFPMPEAKAVWDEKRADPLAYLERIRAWYRRRAVRENE